ncbi:MAG: CopG family antitoxin [Parvularcula sp.]|jgi:predicted DNA binding CopG/RHH family protein|nr:CopG family antitoxin [Parvularcula sp.]
MSKQGKPWPTLHSDEEAERFVAEADLSEYDWSALKPVSYEFEDKSARVTMRMPESQLAHIRAEADKEEEKDADNPLR